MTVKEHYDEHLAAFYSWMAGDFDTKEQAFRAFLETHGLLPAGSGTALDLGAGHGIQSVALAKSGYRVKAVDFNRQLLAELETHAVGLDVLTMEGDIKLVRRYAEVPPELIVCCGDTLTHLESPEVIGHFLADICKTLEKGGKLVLSFRDYSRELTGTQQFIPVKSDDTKILTCLLDYLPKTVRVTDLLHEKTADGWEQKVSSYEKVRIAPETIARLLQQNNMTIRLNEPVQGLTTIIAAQS